MITLKKIMFAGAVIIILAGAYFLYNKNHLAIESKNYIQYANETSGVHFLIPKDCNLYKNNAGFLCQSLDYKQSDQRQYANEAPTQGYVIEFTTNEEVERFKPDSAWKELFLERCKTITCVEKDFGGHPAFIMKSEGTTKQSIILTHKDGITYTVGVSASDNKKSEEITTQIEKSFSWK